MDLMPADGFYLVAGLLIAYLAWYWRANWLFVRNRIMPWSETALWIVGGTLMATAALYAAGQWINLNAALA